MESSAFKLFGKTIQPAETAPATSPESSEEEDASTAVAVVDKATSTAVGRAGKAGLSCPRCKSKETKFCYFNNYNVNQPRHFCKACHRYWTAGGTLRNVPIGAGRRKNQAQPTARPAGISTKEEEEVERWMHASLTNPPPLRPAVDL